MKHSMKYIRGVLSSMPYRSRQWWTVAGGTTVWEEFEELCDHYGWGDNGDGKRWAKREFKKAMIAEFGSIYGTDSDSLDPWKELCQAIQITPIPDNVNDCRRVRNSTRIHYTISKTHLMHYFHIS